MPSLAEMLLADQAKGQSGFAPRQPSKLAQALGMGYPATQAPQMPPMPEQRPVYDFDMPRDPIDRYAREQEAWNNSTVTPQQASANKKQNFRDLLSIIPGPGNVIAAEDAYHGAQDAASQFGEGNYGKGALSTALAALSGAGAFFGLPTGRLAGNVAKGAKDVAPAFPAWHGSPHDFDEFKLDKIGTGEGAQAYGHGLYFAENPAVAKEYQKQLTERAGVSYKMADGSIYQPSGMDPPIAMNAILDNKQPVDHWLDWSAEDLNNPQIRELVETLRKSGPPVERIQPNAGRLYNVEIDAEPHQLLDWDKPLSEQGEVGAKALSVFERMGFTSDPARTLGDIKQIANERFGRGSFKEAEVSNALREAGIPGIRYADQGSREAVNVNDIRGSLSMWQSALKKAPNDEYARQQVDNFKAQLAEAERPLTSNYVIFDDKLTKILSKE